MVDSGTYGYLPRGKSVLHLFTVQAIVSILLLAIMIGADAIVVVNLG